MVDLKALQKAVYQNKVDHNFNVTDIPFEFCLLMTEVAEAFRSRDTGEYGEELADIAIYLLGLAEIGGVRGDLIRDATVSNVFEIRQA